MSQSTIFQSHSDGFLDLTSTKQETELSCSSNKNGTYCRNRTCDPLVFVSGLEYYTIQRLTLYDQVKNIPLKHRFIFFYKSEDQKVLKYSPDRSQEILVQIYQLAHTIFEPVSSIN